MSQIGYNSDKDNGTQECFVIIPEKGSNGSRVGQRGTSHNTSLRAVSALATGSLEARMTLQSWLK